VVYCSSLVFKESVYSTQILLRIGFAAVLIITLHTAALWSAQETLNFEGGDHTASHANEYMVSHIVEMVPNSFCTIFAILNNAYK
jgi:hypothetical protein